MRGAAAALAAAIDAIVERLERGGRLVYVGAGTSGRLAAVGRGRVRPDVRHPGLVVASSPVARRRGRARGAEDDEEAGAADVAAAGVGAGDAVVAPLGERRDALRARRAPRGGQRAGALTVGVVCARGLASSAASSTTRSSPSSGPR